MERLIVVGSGPSAVHFALSVLKKGYRVTMLDVGNQRTTASDPEYGFAGLRTNLGDPVRYFLGEGYEGVLYPGAKGEYYGFPPNKRHVFTRPPGFDVKSMGFEPLLSFARGGLAETWTGGVYPLNDDELQGFPIGYSELEPYYGEVAERIGIAGEKDDLTRYFPLHEHLMPGLRLDEHSKQLLDLYQGRKEELNNGLRIYLGRSRIATLSRDKDERRACSYKGRCLWGCPSRSLYTPSVTLEQCHEFPNFTYLPQMYVSHFEYDSRGKIQNIVAEYLAEARNHRFDGDRFILAAGALSSSKIFIDSIYRERGAIVKLAGLMDNRQILIPYVNLAMVGRRYNPESYQYHQLAMGIETDRPEEYIHCQITTLKAALVHPIIQNIPVDLRTAVFIFRNVRAGLGIVNVNLHDRRRESNYVTLEEDRDTGGSRLVIRYSPPGDEGARIRRAIRSVKKCLWRLGCLVPPGMVHVRPMGASAHYAGTIPMSEKKVAFTTSRNCQSHDFENLYIVDGTTFPFLPAKNLTFTLMANAVRVAQEAF